MVPEYKYQILISNEATGEFKRICNAYWDLEYVESWNQSRHVYSVAMLREIYGLKQTEILDVVQQYSCAISPLHKCQVCSGYLGANRVRTAEYDDPPSLLGTPSFLKSAKFSDRQLLTALSNINPQLGLCESCGEHLVSIDKKAGELRPLLQAIIIASSIQQGAIDELSPNAVLLLEGMSRLRSFQKSFLALSLGKDEAESLFLECKRKSCLLVDNSGWWFPSGKEECDFLALLPREMLGLSYQCDTHVEDLPSSEIQRYLNEFKRKRNEGLKAELGETIDKLRSQRPLTN